LRPEAIRTVFLALEEVAMGNGVSGLGKAGEYSIPALRKPSVARAVSRCFL
jgi:hypothetical protein